MITSLNIIHVMILIIIFIFFATVIKETLSRKTVKNKNINKFCNSSIFRLFIACLYFVLLSVFTYETCDVNHQGTDHIILKKCGITMTNGTVFLLTILFFMWLKFNNYFEIKYIEFLHYFKIK